MYNYIITLQTDCLLPLVFQTGCMDVHTQQRTYVEATWYTFIINMVFIDVKLGCYFTSILYCIYL